MVAPALDYIEVYGTFLLGHADSEDPNTYPDTSQAVGTVVFTPNLAKDSLPLLHVPTGALVWPASVTATIRADGRIVPPADGMSAAPSEVAMDVNQDPPHTRLIAPDQEFDVTGWTWTATFEPANGKWQRFTRVIGGAGNTAPINLGTADRPASGGLTQVLVFDVAADENGEPVQPYPEGFRPGIDFLMTPDLTLWSVD